MTSIQPTPQATGATPVTPAADAARHRPDTAIDYGPPAWLPLILTTVAVACAWFAIYVYLTYRDFESLILLAVALVYAGVALGFDVWAAVTVKRAKADV
jgi:hypothetical protein